MIAIVTVLSAFPLGFFLRSRLAATTAYALAYLWAFTFQTLYLVLGMLDHEENPAFTPQHFPVSYGVVALSIFVAGIGLVNLGHWVRRRRQASSSSAATGTSPMAASGKTAASANVAG